MDENPLMSSTKCMKLSKKLWARGVTSHRGNPRTRAGIARRFQTRFGRPRMTLLYDPRRSRALLLLGPLEIRYSAPRACADAIGIVVRRGIESTSACLMALTCSRIWPLTSTQAIKGVRSLFRRWPMKKTPNPSHVMLVRSCCFSAWRARASSTRRSSSVG